VAINQKIPNTLNILLAGKHGGNLDTLIIAHINIARQRVALISVPRDIFINGRKINSAYNYYGISELKRELGLITGLYINHYVIIDMYAFIDVIDLIGGINVYLPAPLIDPTYKTFDNGEWGTLYYEKGEHHLSGVQALRLARSRNTSSDFARAERQHLILSAIKNKVNSLNVGDANKVRKIIGVVLSKTETDLSLKTAISYILRFKNYPIKTGGVLNTFNVLKSETTTAEPPDEEKQEKCYRQLPYANQVVEIQCAPRIEGMYILLPREDWNAVRWYVRRLLN